MLARCLSIPLLACILYVLYNAAHLLSSTVGLFDLNGSCVVSCPENHMVENNMCIACVGPCPQGTECRGWSGTEAVGNDDILEEFLSKECVIVNGHIRFNALTAECRNQDVNQFCNPS